MTLTVTQLRLHIDTPLGDAALLGLLTAAYQAVDQRIEPAGPMSELLTASGPLLMLSREADVISQVIENGVELDETDYELRSSGQMLRRLQLGALHGSWRWRGRVDVTYLPREDDALRDSVAIQLIKLDVNTQHGISQQSIGSWSESYNLAAGSYIDQRESILSSLRPVGILL